MPDPLPQTLIDAGVRYVPAYLDAKSQAALATATIARAEAAGWLAPRTPGGQPFSVRQMNFGPLGWISDAKGYRYEARHPETGAPWPDMPDAVGAAWADLLPDAPPPQCCLVNHYEGAAKMGLHRDADEDDLETPILSLSLGQPARFRIGGPARRGSTSSLLLNSGDAIILGGEARRFYHGIDGLRAAEPLLTPSMPFEGRLNLTLRRVTRADGQPA